MGDHRHIHKLYIYTTLTIGELICLHMLLPPKGPDRSAEYGLEVKGEEGSAGREEGRGNLKSKGDCSCANKSRLLSEWTCRSL